VTMVADELRLHTMIVMVWPELPISKGVAQEARVKGIHSLHSPSTGTSNAAHVRHATLLSRFNITKTLRRAMEPVAT
jgi:hypothetical protein